MGTPTAIHSTNEHAHKVRSSSLCYLLGAFFLRIVCTARSPNADLADAPGLDHNNWACGGQGQGCLGPPGATPATQGGPGGLLNGARGRRGGGEDFCTAPRTRRGTSPPWTQIEDVVSWALTEVTEGGSGAPTTRWDRGNHQLPPDRPHGAGRILSTGDIFGLTCRASSAPCGFKSGPLGRCGVAWRNPRPVGFSAKRVVA